jgi:hypothetical protein
MGLLEDSVKGVAIGVGAVVGLGLVSPVLGDRGRPLAKRIVRGYLNLRDKLQEAGAETKEQISDLMAEVKAERARPAAAPKAAARDGQEGRRGKRTGAARKKATARTTTGRKTPG